MSLTDTTTVQTTQLLVQRALYPMECHLTAHLTFLISIRGVPGDLGYVK